MREEQFQCPLVGGMQELGPVEALLALALLEQKVIATVALEGELTASGTPNSLLRAAVGLELGHAKAESRGNSERCKGPIHHRPYRR